MGAARETASMRGYFEEAIFYARCGQVSAAEFELAKALLSAQSPREDFPYHEYFGIEELALRRGIERCEAEMEACRKAIEQGNHSRFYALLLETASKDRGYYQGQREKIPLLRSLLTRRGDANERKSP